MVISFKFLQCKRAHPPEIKDVIAIRERRERWIERRRVMTKPRAFGKSEFSVTLSSGASVTIDEGSAWMGGGYPFGSVKPADPFYIDPVTQKRFKVTNSPNEHEILKMFKFYGVDINKTYKCPACDLEADIRTILPHLNNDKGVNVFMLEGFTEKYGSHGWNFKQLGKWMETLGY